MTNTIRRLTGTGLGRVVLVALALYALIVLGDSSRRLVGAGPYRRSYEGEILEKKTSAVGWFIQIISGRAIFGPTDKGTRQAPVGPWRLVLRTSQGEVFEVAVPRRIYEQALPGTNIQRRSGTSTPVLMQAPVRQ